MKYSLNIFATSLASLMLLLAPFGGVFMVQAEHAEGLAADAVEANGLFVQAQADVAAAKENLVFAQAEEGIAQQAVIDAGIAKTTAETARDAARLVVDDGTALNLAEIVVSEKTTALTLATNTLNDIPNGAIFKRSQAQNALKDLEAIEKNMQKEAGKAALASAQAEADDAVSAYYAAQREDTANTIANRDNDASNTVDLAGVGAACLAGSVEKAVVAQFARATTLYAAKIAGGLTGLGSSAPALLFVPVVDPTGNSVAGATGGTTLAAASQAGVIVPFLDTLAYATAQCALEQLTNSTINWIRGGFDGSPKYAISTEQLFANQAGQVANDFARTIRGLAVCNFTPNFKNDLANYVDVSSNLSNGFTDQVSCPFGSGQFVTFSAQEASQGIQDAGWQGFEKMLSDRGNPFGVTLLTNRELALRQEKSADQKKQKLSWSNGFADIIDKNDCNYPPDIAERMLVTRADEEPLSLENIDFYEKTYCNTTTPGKILGDQLNKSLGIKSDRLGFADNMNKIIGALFEELARQGTGSAFRGLNDVFGNDPNGN